MITKEITFNTPEYRNSLSLRSKILRLPLGKELSAADTQGEDNQIHFGCWSGDQLIACVLAKPTEDQSRVKLRQMAVAQSYQGQGVGTKLILNFEKLLQTRGIRSIELSARRTAILFYQKLAYTELGSAYLEQGIEHIKMQKDI